MKKRLNNNTNADLEKKLLLGGFDLVIGIDEVGRGSWAGPIVIVAFWFSANQKIFNEVTDSKALSKKHREKLFSLLSNQKYSIGCTTSWEIDKVGLSISVKNAMHRALSGFPIDLKKTFILCDGGLCPDLKYNFKTIVKGDCKHYSIAAASILAKVIRDKMMVSMSKKFPFYNFEKNVGYGTKKHIIGLQNYGACLIHRLSYKPVQRIHNEYKFSK